MLRPVPLAVLTFPERIDETVTRRRSRFFFFKARRPFLFSLTFTVFDLPTRAVKLFLPSLAPAPRTVTVPLPAAGQVTRTDRTRPFILAEREIEQLLRASNLFSQSDEIVSLVSKASTVSVPRPQETFPVSPSADLILCFPAP